MNLVLDSVCKRFGDGRTAQLVLDRVSLTMHTGQFLALLGSSGSGKSTLMRLVAGLEKPTSGSLSLDGQPIRGPGSDRGMVFQKYSLYPWLTAAENVAFGLELKGLERGQIRERTAFYLEVVGLLDSAKRLPRELSGGMQQGWPSRVPWPLSPACCCWMNPLGLSFCRSANPCRNFSTTSGAAPASPCC